MIISSGWLWHLLWSKQNWQHTVCWICTRSKRAFCALDFSVFIFPRHFVSLISLSWFSHGSLKKNLPTTGEAGGWGELHLQVRQHWMLASTSLTSSSSLSPSSSSSNTSIIIAATTIKVFTHRPANIEQASVILHVLKGDYYHDHHYHCDDYHCHNHDNPHLRWR